MNELYITEEHKALAARKHAMSFHTRSKLKSLNDAELFKMEWRDLCSFEK